MAQNILHNEVRFNDYEFAVNYRKKHLKMAVNFADEYKYKLVKKDFAKGRILDAGCGFGETLIKLGDYFTESELYGIDLSESFITMANEGKIGKGLNERVNFQKADIHRIPFPNNFFEVIINTNMLHIVEDPVLMLNEIERVLSPTGIFLIADIKKSFLGIVEKEIRSALTETELTEITSKSVLRKGNVKTGLLST